MPSLIDNYSPQELAQFIFVIENLYELRKRDTPCEDAEAFYKRLFEHHVGESHDTFPRIKLPDLLQDKVSCGEPPSKKLLEALNAENAHAE